MLVTGVPPSGNDSIPPFTAGALGPGAPYPAVTDDRGKFTIEGIEPGTYVLAAEHLGFVESKYGEATGQVVRLRLTPGEILTDINVNCHHKP